MIKTHIADTVNKCFTSFLFLKSCNIAYRYAWYKFDLHLFDWCLFSFSFPAFPQNPLRWEFPRQSFCFKDIICVQRDGKNANIPHTVEDFSSHCHYGNWKLLEVYGIKAGRMKLHFTDVCSTKIHLCKVSPAMLLRKSKCRLHTPA